MVVAPVGCTAGRIRSRNCNCRGTSLTDVEYHNREETPMNTTHCTAYGMPCLGGDSGMDCPVERCDYARKILESMHLFRLGARVGLAEQLTGLEKKTLKRLYRQLMGKPSPPGQQPFSDTWLLENVRYQFHANLIWNLYHRLKQPEYSPARILIAIYEVYIQMAGEPRLNLTRVAFVVQLFATGLWNEHRCDLCETVYPSPADSSQSICPGCRLYFRQRCRRCKATLSPKSKGVRRKRCNHCSAVLD